MGSETNEIAAVRELVRNGSPYWIAATGAIDAEVVLKRGQEMYAGINSLLALHNRATSPVGKAERAVVEWAHRWKPDEASMAFSGCYDDLRSLAPLLDALANAVAEEKREGT